MNTPRISVVIPAYNHALSLPKAIGSVREQNWPGVEIIVVDDGSRDETPRVMEELAGGDLRYIRQANAGAASARNRGIRESTSEWVAFLDADDIWLPGKLLTQMTELQSRPEASFSYTDVWLRYEDETETVRECGTGDKTLLSKLLTGNLFATPTVIVRRHCFEEIGAFDAELRTGEDWDMWLRLAAHFDWVHVSRPLATIRTTTSETKFPLPVLERCTLRVLDRLFSCPHVLRQWPEVAAKRRLVYAWHYSVLAKSYLRQRLFKDFCRLTLRAARSHPAALRYIARSGKVELEN